MIRIALLLVVVVSVACGRTNTRPRDPFIAISESTLRFVARVGQSVTPSEVVITEAGGATVRWRAIPSVPWIVVDRSSGWTPASVRVGVATNGTAPGTKIGSVRFEVNDGDLSIRALLMVELALEAPGWTELDGPRGGAVNALAVDPNDPTRVLALAPSSFFAGNSPGGSYLSADGGASFEHMPGLLDGRTMSSLAVAPSGRAYAGAYNSGLRGGVFVSDDTGVTWTATSLTSREVVSVAVSPVDADFVIAVSEGELLVSATAGVGPWLPVSTLAAPVFVTADETTPERFFVGDRDGNLYWMLRDNPGPPIVTEPSLVMLAALALPSGRWIVTLDHPGANKYLLSDDQGGTWFAGGTGLGVATTTRFVTMPDGLWALGSGGAFVSADSGKTFFAIGGVGSMSSAAIYGATSHPDGILVSTPVDGVLRFDGAANFSAVKMFAHRITNLEVHPSSDEVVVTTGVGGIARWSPTTGFQSMAGSGFRGGALMEFSLHPNNPGNVCTANYALGASLRCTIDYGANWTETAVASIDDRLFGVSRSPSNPDCIWVCSTVGLHHSVDGVVFVAAPGTAGCVHVVATSCDEALYNEGGIRRYVWSGSTSVALTTTPAKFLRRTLDGSIWWYDGVDGLQRSSDRGITFAAVPSGSTAAPTDVAVDPADPNRMFVGYVDSLIESRDAGATWTSLGAPFGVSVLAFDSAGGSLFVGTIGGGLYRWMPVF